MSNDELLDILGLVILTLGFMGWTVLMFWSGYVVGRADRWIKRLKDLERK